MQGWGRQGLLQGQGEACQVAGKIHEAPGPFASYMEVWGGGSKQEHQGF